MSNVIQLKPNCTTHELNNPADGDLVLIPKGWYESTLTNWKTGYLFGAPKVVMMFTITDAGEHFGKVIPKYYNVKRLLKKQGIKGKFVAKPRGDLLKDWYSLYPDSPILRTDKIPMTKMQREPVMIQVDTVMKDYQQNEYAHQMRYSTVRSLKRT